MKVNSVRNIAKRILFEMREQSQKVNERMEKMEGRFEEMEGQLGKVQHQLEEVSTQTNFNYEAIVRHRIETSEGKEFASLANIESIDDYSTKLWFGFGNVPAKLTDAVDKHRKDPSFADFLIKFVHAGEEIKTLLSNILQGKEVSDEDLKRFQRIKRSDVVDTILVALVDTRKLSFCGYKVNTEARASLLDTRKVRCYRELQMAALVHWANPDSESPCYQLEVNVCGKCTIPMSPPADHSSIDIIRGEVKTTSKQKEKAFEQLLRILHIDCRIAKELLHIEEVNGEGKMYFRTGKTPVEKTIYTPNGKIVLTSQLLG
jgi:DNA-binding protein H-NS